MNMPTIALETLFSGYGVCEWGAELAFFLCWASHYRPGNALQISVLRC